MLNEAAFWSSFCFVCGIGLGYLIGMARAKRRREEFMRAAQSTKRRL